MHDSQYNNEQEQEANFTGLEPLYPENKEWFEEGIKAIEKSLANHNNFNTWLATHKDATSENGVKGWSLNNGS